MMPIGILPAWKSESVTRAWRSFTLKATRADNVSLTPYSVA